MDKMVPLTVKSLSVQYFSGGIFTQLQIVQLFTVTGTELSGSQFELHFNIFTAITQDLTVSKQKF